MPHNCFALLTELALDPANGWSIGSFGAIGEFVRDADEPADIVQGDNMLHIATSRGAMRIAPVTTLTPLAWDSLSADGESWGHTLAFCVDRPVTGNRAIMALGSDAEAIRDQDREAALFDLGVGAGVVRMCLRTRDAALIRALNAAEGTALLAIPSLMAEVLRAQPQRVLLSPAGRIEVFQPIPMPDGKSPVGPHTHLLTKLTPKDRAHSSNTPIPQGQQSAISVHPVRLGVRCWANAIPLIRRSTLPLPRSCNAMDWRKTPAWRAHCCVRSKTGQPPNLPNGPIPGAGAPRRASCCGASPQRETAA